MSSEAETEGLDPLGTRTVKDSTRKLPYEHPLLERYPYIVDFHWEIGQPLEEYSKEWIAGFIEESYRRLIDPTYLRDVMAAIEAGDQLLEAAVQAMETQRYETAKTLLDSIGHSLNREFRVYNSSYGVGEKNYRALDRAQREGLLSPNLQAINWDSVAAAVEFWDFYVYKEERQLWSQYVRRWEVEDSLFFYMTERDMEQGGALLTRRDTFDRLIEVVTLWAFDARRKGLAFRDGLPTVRLLKSIEMERSKLTLRTRCEDCHRVVRGTDTISLKHPKDTMGYIQSLMSYFYQRSDAPRHLRSDLLREFSRVDEVVVVLYFPGSEAGTESVIAQVGLKRRFFDKEEWKKLKAKDGTLQDYLKVHGTYWLHPEMPDMGTPAHLLR